MSFDTVDKREAQRKEHKKMSSASRAIGNVGLWYGNGKIEFQGNFQLGFNKEGQKFNIVLFPPNPEKGEVSYAYSGFVTLPNPDNEWKVRQHREHGAYVQETKLGPCFFYEGKAGSLYILVYFDSGDNYRLTLEENQTTNAKAPCLKGFVYPLQNPDVKDTREENIQRKAVRRDIGVAKNKFFEQEPTTAEEVLEVLSNSKLTDDDYIDIMLGLLTRFGSLTNFKEAATERLSKKEIEPQLNKVEVEEFDDDEEAEYEEVVHEPTSVEIPVMTPAPKERIAEVVKNSDYTREKKVSSLNIRLADVSSSLVEGIDEEGELV